MQVLITHEGTARTRVWRVSRWQLGLWVGAALLALLMVSGAVYHFIFLTAAREGWPVVSQIVKLIVRDEIAQRDRFVRENLDAMAQRVGEMQAKLIRLEAIGERLSGASGVKVEGLKPLPRTTDGGKGGPYVPASPNMDQLGAWLSTLDESADQHADLFTLIESRLLQERLQALMVPNQKPVDGPVGSGFGFRPDPFSGRAALHQGLDFPADVGTPIVAAAGGVVLASEWHPAYGQVVEIDHSNGLVTRYAHASRVSVKAGDLVKRGQPIAQVGTSGRSTGPHLHFEVLVDGVPQDPLRFLEGRAKPPAMAATRR